MTETITEPMTSEIRRALFAAIATAAEHLPAPIAVNIYPANGAADAWAKVHLPDNDTAGVDAWSAAYGGRAAVVGPPVRTEHPDGTVRVFRSYRAPATVAGWPTQISTYVDEPDTGKDA